MCILISSFALSPFTSKYGLAADNFVEFKVVTADGQLQVANQRENPSLFWALRGGGAGFGVVVEATMKAYPTPKISMIRWWLKASPNDTKAIFDPAAYIMSKLPGLNAKGVQGFFYVYPTSMWGYFLTAEADAGLSKAKELWEPVIEEAVKFPGMEKPIYQYSNFDNFKQYFDWRFRPLTPADPNLPLPVEKPTTRGVSPLDSRLLGASHLTSPKLAAALRDAMPLSSKNAMLRGHLVSGGQVAKGGSDTSVNPAWRNSLVHIISSGSEPNATSLKKLAPDTGCYINEVSGKTERYAFTY
jgi:hypothetical protein